MLSARALPIIQHRILSATAKRWTSFFSTFIVGAAHWMMQKNVPPNADYSTVNGDD